MKTTTIASVLIALSLAASSNAFAQRDGYGNDHNNRNDRAEQRQDERHDNRDNRDNHDNRDNRDNDRHDNGRHNGFENHGNDRRDDFAQHYHRDDMRGGGPRHDLRRGQRLDREYRNNRYVVTDWRERHLSAPPRGHHWVRAGNDYVLAAIATGVIAQVLLSN